MLVHKPTPLATYRFHGSRASLGKRANRRSGIQLESGLGTCPVSRTYQALLAATVQK